MGRETERDFSRAHVRVSRRVSRRVRRVWWIRVSNRRWCNLVFTTTVDCWQSNILTLDLHLLLKIRIEFWWLGFGSHGGASVISQNSHQIYWVSDSTQIACEWSWAVNRQISQFYLWKKVKYEHWQWHLIVSWLQLLLNNLKDRPSTSQNQSKS